MNVPPRLKFASPASLRLGRRSLVAVAVGITVSWLIGASARADASHDESFVVIVNAGNPAKSAGREFVADAFLKKASRWDDGEALRPVDLQPSAPARRAFSTGVLRRTVAAVRSYWQQRIFSGRDVPPPELESEEALLRYVAKYRGALGYVSTTTRLDGGYVKVIVVR